MAKKKKDNSVIFGKTKKLTEATLDMDNETVERLVSYARNVMPDAELAGIVGTYLLGKMTKEDFKRIEKEMLAQQKAKVNGKQKA